MDNFLNILKIDVDRSDRVYNTSNLSLNQCSNNNRIALYYDPESEYSDITMSFRKPDGWLSDRVALIFDVDDNGLKYAYYDIHEGFTSFIMGGRSAILTANIYFHRKIKTTDPITGVDTEKSISTSVGNIRINVNYVDDKNVNTDVTGAYVENLYSIVGALQNSFNEFETGNIQVGKALMDGEDNVIHRHYETKADAIDKFNTLDDKKLDKTDVQDQTQRLDMLETEANTVNTRITSLDKTLSNTTTTSETNKADIATLKETTVSDTEFNKAIDERKAAEVNLQSQIDGMHQLSLFREMVSTLSVLTPAYGVSKEYKEGDRVLVLADNTVYKWDGNDFIYVGKYGSATYTKAEIDAFHNNITNTIPNKATLSNGELKLSKGNTPISTEQVKVKTVNGESIWGEGNIVIPVDNEFSITSTNPVENRLITGALESKANQSEISFLNSLIEEKASKNEVNLKQDKLTEGANIKIYKEDGKTYISASTAITLRKVPYENLEDMPMDERFNNIIYLYKPVNENTYSEFLWDEQEQRFEPFGEAGLHLEKYYTSLQVDELLTLKVDKEIYDLLDARVARNTAAIETKADRETTTNSVNALSAAVLNLQSAVSTKADNEDLEEYARKDSVPEAYQEKLVSGLNIKKLKTADGVFDLIDGEGGELALTGMSITDLGEYYRKDEADPIFDQKVNVSDFNTALSEKANQSELNVYRRISDSYSKEEVDQALVDLDIENKLGNYYNKEEVNAQIEAIDLTDDLKDYAKTEYVDAEVKKVDDKFANYVTNEKASVTYITQTTAISSFATKEELINEINQIPVPANKTSQLINDSGFITKLDIPTDLNAFTNGPGYLTTETPAFKNKQDALVSGTNIKTINGESLLGNGNIKIVTDISHLETKSDASSKLTEAKAYSDTNRRELQTSISSNTSLISSLRTDLSNEISNRTKGDADTLASAKTYTDTTIRDVIEDTEGALEAIKQIKEQIGTGESGVGGILSSINTNKTDIANVRSDLTTEISNRNTAERNLQTQITENTEDIESLQSQLNTEITNRTRGDATLDSNITTLNTKVDDNIKRIDDDLISLNNKITAEEAARIAEDTNIYSVIDSFTGQTNTKITNINSTVSSLDTRLTSAQKDISDHKIAADTKFLELNNKVGMKILFKNWTV